MLADGGAGIGVRHSLGLDGRAVQRGPFGLEEGENAHLEFAPEGAVLKGGEEAIQFKQACFKHSSNSM